MKKIITLSLAMLLSISSTYAQNFKGHISATFGIINPKARIQCEIPLKNRASLGVNMNYYFYGWKGPVFEPFIRLYDKKNGNVKGSFIQAKLMYGNLSTYSLPYSVEETLENKNWSTFGFGICAGNKLLFAKHFTIEPLIGFRFLSPPPNFAKADDDITWKLTTGFLLDLQLKFGYQF